VLHKVEPAIYCVSTCSHVVQTLIITPPEDQAIALGENFTFTCIASGTNPPSILWTQIVDGNATVPIDIQILEMGNTVNSTLTISDVLEEDFGSYQCIASDRLIIDIVNFTVYQAGKQNIKANYVIAIPWL